MKRIILLNKQIKPYLYKKLKDKNIKINEKCDSYIIVNNDIQIVFKEINYKRPADFYKYNDKDIFVQILPTYEPIHSLEYNNNKEFFEKLNKKRNIIYLENINELIPYINNNKYLKIIPLKIKKIIFNKISKNSTHLYR